jgi:hypothetical protein
MKGTLSLVALFGCLIILKALSGFWLPYHPESPVLHPILEMCLLNGARGLIKSFCTPATLPNKLHITFRWKKPGFSENAPVVLLAYLTQIVSHFYASHT